MENNNYIAHWGIKGMKWGIRKKEEEKEEEEKDEEEDEEEDEDERNQVRRKSNSDIRGSEPDERVTAKERMHYYDQDKKMELARERYNYKINEKQNERYANSDYLESKYNISEMRATKLIAGITTASLAAVSIIKAVGVLKGKNMDGVDSGSGSDSDTTPKKKGFFRKIFS